MSIATKLGLAYCAWHNDPYRSRREVILTDHLTSSNISPVHRVQPSSWFTEIVAQQYYASIKEIQDIENKEKERIMEHVERESDHTPGKFRQKLSPPATTTSEKPNVIQQCPINEEVVSIQPVIEEPLMVHDNKDDTIIQENETRETNNNSQAPGEEEPLIVPVKARVTEEIGISAHPFTIDVGTEMDNEIEPELEKGDLSAESEVCGLIPVNCVSEVVDRIIQRIQEHNVRAVALDDLNQQITENIRTASSPNKVVNNTSTSFTEHSHSNPPKQDIAPTAPYNSNPDKLDDSGKRELALHLYALRDQVHHLQQQLETREQVLQRQLMQRQRMQKTKKVTVEIVKGYEEDPVPYKKPPFRLAQKRDETGEMQNETYEEDFEESSMTRKSLSSDHSISTSLLSSDPVTEITSHVTKPSTPRGHRAFSSSSSSTTTTLLSSASSVKWPPRRRNPPQQKVSSAARSLSSDHSSTFENSSRMKSEGFISETVTSSGTSSSSTSHISIDEAAAQDFWARRLKPQPKNVSPSSSTYSDTTSTVSS